MSKAKEVIAIMDEVGVSGHPEVAGKPISSLADVKVNDWVMYKSGHEYDGMTGIVVGMHPDSNTLDLKVGKATKIAVPLADLVAIPVPSGQPAAPASA